MKSFSLFLFFPLAVALSQDALPTVDQVLDKYVEGLGGKAALEKLKGRSAKGSMELPDYGVTATYETYAKMPDQTVSITTVEGYGVVREGFDGKVAWTDNPERGIRESEGDELAQRKRAAVFNRPLHFKDPYQTMAVKGKQAVGGRDAIILGGTLSGGKEERFSFDAETGLLVQTEADLVTENGIIRATTTLSDYKEVDGVKVPMTIRLQSQGLNFTLRFTEVKHNVEIDDAKFKKPTP